ncbi:hypothetical protein C882_2804 [Caenispirillum salinarum AK4]|uniref:DUF2946 domain-containing protein n=1 Tax=Caenispirillum salinarum AK4 TaxID=1238182 RepID=K9GNS2_9PROT|nr:DUF2946 family protein [Caenispirillum salinarum]EKV26369.1 hypothetical protein C882_2804 [Caenispirillum salinarum AK4]
MPTTLSFQPTVDSAWRRRAMGWMGLVILGLGLLAVASASFRLPELPSPGTGTELPFGQMVICTGSGLRIIDMTADGADATPAQAQHPADDLCLMCLPVSPEAATLAVMAVAVLLLAGHALPLAMPAPASSDRPRRPRGCGATRVTRGPPGARG